MNHLPVWRPVSEWLSVLFSPLVTCVGEHFLFNKGIRIRKYIFPGGVNQLMRFQNPPLVERNCELCFVPGKEWDDIYLGLFYSQIQKEFPICRTKQEMALEIRGEEELFHPLLAIKKQFFTADKRSLVQMGKNMLVFNQLRPCGPWEQFLSLALKNRKPYLALLEPLGIRRISLRFINRFVVPDHPFSYLTLVPTGPVPLMESFSHFDMNLSGSGKDSLAQGGQLMVRVSSRPSTTGYSITLYLNYSQEETQGWMGFEEEFFLSWLHKAQGVIQETFFQAITEKAWDLFVPIKGEGDASCPKD